MHLKFVLSVVSLVILGVFCAGPNPDADRVDLDHLFKALFDPCNDKCSSSLKPALINTLKLVNVFDSSKQLCNSYDQTLNCAKKNFCVKTQTVAVATSGLDDLCKTDKHTFVVDNEKCIKPKLDGVSQKCDATCSFVKAFADYTQNPTVKNALTPLQLVDQLGGVCQSLECYLPCLRDGLNDCPRAGNVITSGVLHPFYVVADFLSKMAPSVQQLVAQKLPKSCAPLINISVLNNITGTTN